MNKKDANDLLHVSDNKIARSLLGRISTCTDITNEVSDIYNDIEHVNKEKLVTESEYEALTILYYDMIRIKLTEFNISDIFKKRIWSKSDISKVVQFRNIVTDMLMLEFVSFDEYIELSDEIDRYIRYALSNGGLK